MKLKRILFSFSLIFSMLFVGYTKSYAIFGIENKTKASLIGDVQSGGLFLSENIEEQLSIASISKLMNYFVVRDAIEEGKIKREDVVTISKASASEEGSSLDLLEGEKITINDLLDGLMVVSGNDAAHALAEAVSGSEEEFVKLMNNKAKEIGLEAAEFTNASGLTKNSADNKMSTKDIFTMSKALIEKYPEVLEYSKKTVLEQPNRNYKRESTIPLVGEVNGVDGLKTGYTEEAGYCLVSTMKITKGQSEFRVIAILMGVNTKEERAQYMKDMLNYVKENISTKKLVDSSTFVKRVTINSSTKGYVDIVPEKDVERITLKNINYEFETEISKIKLPLKKGDKVGEIRVKNSEKIVETVNLIASDNYEKTGFLKRVGRFFMEILKTVETILP
ncbi:MAG: D-alanyl-D-alanine carboxypeptidase [Peptoniphilaceae bacterium]|uniref:D-alanyl-D-alanine carboxypeptidase family protein n=1 Tax=Parvimonas sp. TaxID=1944660 RepID=UPI002600D23B|nr:D-alanyl-D-alanine carboxypeptidase family protein [Parvimonas sp.]MCI5997642.1 D-alanyl-D-alanine carboxypeptidase [Parvimonas sp.]MDD7765334.1 D-alanyl-D-alanine carboxypeptidase [Peptoniphilaceae bacterium]MDY3051253.1 D-alanyl-D-alanine carboxypeptidase family protein [Parvimonas sp.]